MKSLRPSGPYWGAFSHFFRVQVHQLIAWGYENACDKIRSSDEQEPSITGFIAEAINDRFCALDCPGWCTYYSVRDDPPVRKSGRSGKSRPRADIIIQAHFPGRPEYVFEAKRLRRNGYPVGKYVAPDGMGCFISGLYASRYNEAAMLGYVQSDTVAYWRHRVKERIDKDGNKLCLIPPQYAKKIIDAFPLEWCSQHERDIVGRPITVYHLLLDCCKT